MTPETTTQKASPKFCTKCGKELLPKSKFCTQCGAPVFNNDLPIITEPQNLEASNKPSRSPKKHINKKLLIPIVSLITVSICSVILIIIFLILNSIFHIICFNHDWDSATCIEAAQCTYCGKYKDEELGNHKWMEATCGKPKTCFWCDLEEGEPLGHSWTTATCTEPKTCEMCGITNGKTANHIEGEWTVTTEPTLVNNGVEKVYCKTCNELINTRDIDKKSPTAIGKSFNFKDDELIDWINDKSTVNVDSTELDLFNNEKNTSYRVTLKDGEVGALILNHGDNGITGNVCGIMVYFEDTDDSAVLTAWLGQKIDSTFSAEDAFYKFYDGKSYISSDLSAVELELDDDFIVYMLAPTEFLADIIS